MPLFAATVFLSAFLLFQVQPIMGKIILPWFGGSPAVWTTCMLFFQVLLLLGYAWSHLLASRLSPRRQATSHLVLLALALASLGASWAIWKVPLVPAASLKPPDSLEPVRRILLLLSLAVGVPYLALSATGPILQAWIARSVPARQAYRLYSLSNAGSLLGLVVYPFALEPLLATRWQARVWAAGFAVFAVLCAGVALRASRAAPAPSSPAAAPPTTDPPKVGLEAVTLWILLPAAASLLLLAVTNHLSQEVAPVPFLWILPLALYLVSFILTFESDRWYRRWMLLPLAALAGVAAVLLGEDTERSLSVAIPVYSLLLFAGCMTAHGELVRLKPGAEHLTAFYLAVSGGGALGGFLAGVVAPLVFRGYWELHVGIVALGAVVVAAVVRDQGGFLSGRSARPLRIAAGVGLVALAGLLFKAALTQQEDVVDSRRDFYGVMRVMRSDARGEEGYWLLHGRILHGAQYLSPAKRHEPTCYYTRKSGLGVTLAALRAEAPEGLKVGVVGLGLGTIAAHGLKGDVMRFYEISPEVVKLAQGDGGFFSFLRDSNAKVEVVLGDARTSLERELAEGPQGYDVFALDAFSSDSIPAHLVTREAFELYLKHLKGPRSLLAIHLSNRYLDLVPVVGRLAEELGLSRRLVVTRGGRDEWAPRSRWLLLARLPAVFDLPELAAAITDPEPSATAPLWTDDHTALLHAVKW